MLRAVSTLLAIVVALVAVPTAPAAAATCSDYPNQAAAQRAHDTRDADHDGVYCESLPCPCSRSSSSPPARSCTKPNGVQKVSFSKTKYPNIRRHFLDAVRRARPVVQMRPAQGGARMVR